MDKPEGLGRLRCGCGCACAEHLDAFDYDIPALRAENAAFREALTEITEGKGAYSVDQLTHAGNTIENMKAIAVAALTAPGGRGP